MKQSYSTKLRDPRWQKKRLRVMERDGFCCQNCGDTTTTLNVHHFEYNGDPWETEDGNLITFCEDCHSFIENSVMGFVPQANVVKIKTSNSDCFFLIIHDSGLTIFQNHQHLVTFSHDSLKKIVHSIINYWLRNDYEHNLIDSTLKNHPNGERPGNTMVLE